MTAKSSRHRSPEEERWQDAGATKEELAVIQKALRAPAIEPLTDRQLRMLATRVGLKIRGKTVTQPRVVLRLAFFTAPVLATFAAVIFFRAQQREDIEHSSSRSTKSVATRVRVESSPTPTPVEPTTERLPLANIKIARLVDEKETKVRIARTPDAHLVGTAKDLYVLSEGAISVQVLGTQNSLRFRAGDLEVEVREAVFSLAATSGVLRVHSGEVLLKEADKTPVVVLAGPQMLPLGRQIEETDARWFEEASTSLRREEQPEEHGVEPRASFNQKSSSRSRREETTHQRWEPGREPKRGRDRAEQPTFDTPPIPSASERRWYDEIREYRRALDLLRSGQPEDAAQAFTRYLEQHPDGILREEAELSRLEAWLRAKASQTFVGQANAWLERHPKHPRADEIRAHVLRIKKDGS